MHEPNYKQSYLMNRNGQRSHMKDGRPWKEKRGNNDKYINKERDCHRRLWWNRRLDRKTTGERWISVVLNYAGKPGPAQAVVADIKAAGGRGIAVQADVAIAADVERLFKESIDAFGRPDVVVHCAGIMPLFPIASGDVAAFDKVIATNLARNLPGIRAGGTTCS